MIVKEVDLEAALPFFIPAVILLLMITISPTFPDSDGDSNDE